MARFGDGLAVGPDLEHAAESAVSQALAPLDGAPDLVCVFICGDDPDAVTRAGEVAMAVAGDATTLGCSASGVIGGSQGVELTSAVSAWAAVLPGVRRTPFALTTIRAPERLVVTGMPEPRPDDRIAVLLADPYGFPVDAFVERSADVLGGLPLVGGLADSLRGRAAVRLFLDGEVVPAGAVGVVLGGPLNVATIVSQGCRPIGPPMIVTRAEGNVLYELAGTPAFEKLEQIVAALPAEEQKLAAGGLHIGIAMNEYAERHERGDFLVRGVVGGDRDLSAITIGDVVEVGQTVRFQVRDAVTADEDLTRLLRRFREEDDFGPVEGALLFSCNGRGSSMFASPDHDVLAVRRNLGAAGVGGFFAAGEIGPVGGRNHVHGYTASVLAFGGPGGAPADHAPGGDA